MITESYSSPAMPLEYSNFPRWTLFPPIPKTHWWAEKLTLEPAGRRNEFHCLVSNGLGVFASGPMPGLGLGIGIYEFHCLLSVNRIPISGRPIGIIRVLSNGTEIAKKLIQVKDFDAKSKEVRSIIEFKLDTPAENIQCQLSSNGVPNVNINLIWIRLVPRFGWRWDAKSLPHVSELSVNDYVVLLKANPHDNNPRFPILWGPYIYLPSGFYTLTALISADPSESQASWDVFSAGRDLESRLPIEFDLLQYSKPQPITRNFYLESGHVEIEFRIFVERAQITVHWLRLVSSDGLIWERYFELGGRNSVLGLPLTAEGRAIPSYRETKGCYRRFEGGTIYFNNYTFQACEVWGAISSLFEDRKRLEEGDRKNQISFPLTSVQPVKSSYGTIGEFQRFEGWGDPVIFSYPSNRSHVCAIYGDISTKYWEVDGPKSSLGFPISEREYDWIQGDKAFRRSDFEGGHITWLSREETFVHCYPKPHIKVECPERIPFGEVLVITVTGELEGGSVSEAYCSVSFPDEVSSIKPEAAEETRKHIYTSWPGEETYGNYGKPDYKLLYPRVEMGIGAGNWPVAPANSFEIHLRPSQPGTFHIYAKMIARDDENTEFWGADPNRRWLDVMPTKCATRCKQ